MLVLQRKPGERILLDNGVQLEVIEIRRRTVRIGVSAPAEVKILREELVARGFDRVQRPAPEHRGERKERRHVRA